MSQDFANPDYEPTAAEIDDFLSGGFVDELEPGQHGSIRIVPAFERYIWGIPVYWGHRHVHKDGSIEFSWCVPAPCPHDNDS